MNRMKLGRAIGALAAVAVGGRIAKGIYGRVKARRAGAGFGDGRLDAGRDSGQSLSPDEIDEASMESFPASDPPSWTPTAASERSNGVESPRA